MKALVVHDSDEVKDCFIGTEEEILNKLRVSEYWEDIVERVEEYEWSEEAQGVFNEDAIKIDQITRLFHDGDSEDGYTLMDVI